MRLPWHASSATDGHLRLKPVRGRRVPDALIGLLLFTGVLLGAFLFVDRMGIEFFVIALGGITTVIILGYASLREMSFALIAWLMIMSGFRWLGMIGMPGLPDLSLDRILLVWIIVIFFFRTVVQGVKLTKPFLPEALLLLHAVYILVQMQFIGSQDHFHYWVLSMFTPFFGFLYGKHTIKRDSEIRNLLVFFMLLTVYYFIQSIAQHFSMDALIWPKMILDKDKGLWHEGRSRGPILHPPLFGQLIAMFLMVYFFFISRARRLSVKIVFFIGLGFTLVGFLFTYTRGPWVAAIVGLIFMAVLSREYRKTISGFIVVGVLAGLLGIMQMANSEFLQERVSNTNTIENRIGFLANTARVIRDHPIFGVGYFRWLDVLGDYNQTTNVPFYGIVRKQVSSEVPIHDIYWGRLAEEGLVGSVLQFSFYFVILQAFLRKWRRNVWSPWFDRNTMVVLGAMMVVYLVGGLIIDYRYFDLVNVLFYFFAGVIYGFDPAEARRQSSDFHPNVAGDSIHGDAA